MSQTIEVCQLWTKITNLTLQGKEYSSLLYIQLTISFLIGRKHTMNFWNQHPGCHPHMAADCTIIMSRTLKLTGNHFMYDHFKWFLRVIMSSSCPLCGLLICIFYMFTNKLSVPVSSDHFFFHSMYHKIIIRFGFCDIQNNQGPTKGYQPNLDYKNIPQKHHQKIYCNFSISKK